MVMVPTIGIPRCRDISIDGLQTEDYSFTIFDYIGLDRFYYARVCTLQYLIDSTEELGGAGQCRVASLNTMGWLH
jgi:hypothetical protein